MTKKVQPAVQEKFKTMIGGQALIEGIMMLGPDKKAIVVRGKDGLVTQVEPMPSSANQKPFYRWPFVRGVFQFGRSMLYGVKALMYSADLSPDSEEENPSKFDLWLERRLGSEKFQKFLISTAAVMGIGFSILLFILLPAFLVELLSGVISGFLVRNLLEGIIRLGIYFAYMFLISKMKEMRRVFSYHGAEHKTIRCYEAKLPLTVENVRKQTRLHPRCGTSFLFVVMAISILVYAVVRLSNPFLRLLLRLVLLPVIVGISYEINRWVGRHDNKLSRILTAPGMWFQNFTTCEPDDSMIEVGIAALTAVLPEQEGADRW